jgi:hypothetical protein
VQLRKSAFVIRLMHWEYWPMHVVYFLIYPYWIWLCIKARSFFFFNAANPSIKNGGFLMESKTAIDALIPAAYKPVSVYVHPSESFQQIQQQLILHQLQYPLIIKPDIGLQGKRVVIVNNETECKQAAANFSIPFVIQEYVDYPMEAGIFYVRHPETNTGTITGIVYKEFVHVVGDGIHTVQSLLFSNPRYILQQQALLQLLDATVLASVPAKDEKIILLPFGNHARGCLFTDASYIIDEQLINVIDDAAKQIDGFYYGRMDIKFSSWEDFKAGKNWKIIELNGAGSEPTHIYDPKHSIFFAWKEIIRHWKMLYQISISNHQKGASYLSFQQGITMHKESAAYFNIIS